MSIQVQAIGIKTIAVKEFRRTFRLWAQTLLPSAITTTLYFLIFGHLMGQRIGVMAGLPYIQFIVPGLIMMSILTTSFNAAAFTVFSAKFQRSIEEILISPMSPNSILLAFITSGLLRGLCVGVIVTLIALCFTHITLHFPVFMVAIALLSSAIFSLMGILNSLYERNFDQISIFPTFVITPLSYLGGIFYSLTVLPVFWQKVALLNPIIYIISTFRYAFYSHADINLVYSIGLMLCFFIILYWLCLRLIQSRKNFIE